MQVVRQLFKDSIMVKALKGSTNKEYTVPLASCSLIDRPVLDHSTSSSSDQLQSTGPLDEKAFVQSFLDDAAALSAEASNAETQAAAPDTD